MDATHTSDRRRGRRLVFHKRAAWWAALLAVCAAGLLAAYHYGAAAPNATVPVAKARIGDLALTVETRGVVRAAVTFTLSVPQGPNLRIVKLAETAKPVRKGEIVVAFAAIESGPGFPETSVGVRAEEDGVERTPPAPPLTDGGGDRAGADLPEQASTQLQSGARSPGRDCDGDCSQAAVLRAPADGIVKIMPNARGAAAFGSPPPFRKGDVVRVGEAIAEIADSSAPRLDLTFEEVDRGRVRVGQAIRFRLDAIPGKEFHATLASIGPAAELTFRPLGPPTKLFPAQATIERPDRRLRPGMSGPASVITGVLRNQLLIPVKGGFLSNGQPAVYVQIGNDFQLHAIEAGQRNDTDLIVTKGLSAGDVVALENPMEAARRAGNP